MGNMSPYYFKTIFTLCMEGIPSFIKIGGAVSEKNGRNGQTFVVLYIGCTFNFMTLYVKNNHSGTTVFYSIVKLTIKVQI